MNKWEHCKSSTMVKWHLGFDHLNISSISSTSSSERASASQQDLQNKNFCCKPFKKNRAKEKVKHREIFKAILNMALINSHTLKKKCR